jgi:hypothetical protein
MMLLDAKTVVTRDKVYYSRFSTKTEPVGDIYIYIYIFVFVYIYSYKRFIARNWLVVVEDGQIPRCIISKSNYEPIV